MKIESKITATNSNTRFVVDFKIKEVISKEQFKNLMAYSDYNSIKKEGKAIFYKNEQAKAFQDYINSINKDEIKYKIEYKKSKTTSKMSFQDYCEDFLDQDIYLMSASDKKEAYKNDYLEMFRDIKNYIK